MSLRMNRPCSLVALWLTLVANLGAQDSAAGLLRGASLPSPRAIAAPQATSTVALGRSIDIHVLSDGRVIVQDRPARRVIVVDSSLSTATVIYDQNTPAPQTYPRTPQVMYGGAGDTTYLAEFQARGFRVISPEGKVVRRESSVDLVPGTSLNSQYAGTIMAPGRRMIFAQPMRSRPVQPGEWASAEGDSLHLMNVSFETLRRDTLGFVFMRMTSRTAYQPGDPNAPGGPTAGGMVMTVPVVEAGDAIALTPDGALAVIRVSDFHVDWLEPNGTWRQSPPVPWPWHKLSAAEKQKMTEEFVRLADSLGSRLVSTVGGVPPPPGAGPRPAPVPDYVPPFVPMSAVPDREGRIWLRLGARSLSRVSGPPTYAIIDRTGQIVDRIVLPMGRSLAGFGAGGSIYLVAATSSASVIERYVLPSK